MQDKFNRYDWDTWFIAQCFMLSLRSIDPSTRHGAVIVDGSHQVLSQGYNGPIAGIDDDLVPLDRPRKYFHLQHAEEAALNRLNAPKDILKKSTIYVTGRPCHRCMRMILNRGIRTIKYGPVSSKMVDSADIEASELMIKSVSINEPVVLQEYTTTHSMQEVYDLIDGLTYSVRKYDT